MQLFEDGPCTQGLELRVEDLVRDRVSYSNSIVRLFLILFVGFF